MRSLMALVLCVLLAPMQAHACLWAGLQDSLFFKTIPTTQPDADVIAQVVLLDASVLDFYKGAATAKVLQVLKTSDERVQQGSVISLKFLVTSCGPTVKAGMSGVIIAKTGTDSNGSLELYPYLINGMGRISSPRSKLPSMDK